MRILHVGGYHAITLALCQEQLRQSLEVTALGMSCSDFFFKMPFACLEIRQEPNRFAEQRFDVIQFHQIESLVNPSVEEPQPFEEPLKILRQSGARLYLYSYADDALGDPAIRARYGISDEIIHKYFDHVFVGSPAAASLAECAKSSSWLPMGVDVTLISPPSRYNRTEGPLRVLHIPFNPSGSADAAVQDAFTSLAKSGGGYQLEIIPADEITDYPALKETLNGCDVYVESATRDYYGYAALLAMAHGKTVLSGLKPSVKQLWDGFSICPVMDCCPSTLEAKIRNLAFEPRSVRDLGRRSREFIERYHNAQTTNRMMLAKYRETR